MLNFDFLEKGLEITSPSDFVHDFSRKMCLMLYSINCPNFIWLPLLKTLVNMCIAIVYFPGYNIIYFEITPIFLIKPFFYLTKKSRQKCKYLENERSFKVGVSPFKKICFICFDESLLKMVKNPFHLILKAFFVLKIFKFLSWLFVHLEEMARLET